MFELKLISKEGVEAALRKAERYRLLNEGWQAESICRDVLRADPGNQRALTILEAFRSTAPSRFAGVIYSAPALREIEEATVAALVSLTGRDLRSAAYLRQVMAEERR